MTITVTTKSGSNILFIQKDNGEVFFQKGMLSGKVVRISPIAIGKEINMDFHKDRLYGGIEEDTMLYRSTPVTNIIVTL